MNIESRILIYEKSGNNLKPIRIYADQQGRKWIESRPDTKFVIEIKNNDYQTYLAVVSVDGLNVLNGQRARMEPSKGYILYHGAMKINGWRTSLKDVREFVFTANKADSYAHKLGADEGNTGVIGLAFFKEKRYIRETYYVDTTDLGGYFKGMCDLPSAYSSTATYSSAVSNTTTRGLGEHTLLSCSVSNNLLNAEREDSFQMSTKQGEVVEDKVVEVKKEFEDAPCIVDFIYYDNRENLIAKGIVREEEKLPEPFANTAFCPSL